MRHSIILLINVVLCASAAAEQLLPASAYGRLPAIFDVALSPDGSKIAIGRNTSDGEQYIEVLEIASGKRITGIRQRDTLNAAEKPTIRRIGWADDKRVFYEQHTTLSANNNLPVGLLTPGRRYIDLLHTALFDIKRQRSSMVRLNTDEDWVLSFSNLRGLGRKAEGGMEIRSSPYRSATLNVYSVDLGTGNTSTLVRGSQQTVRFVFDGNLRPVARLDVNEATNTWQLISVEDGADRTITSGASETGGVGLAGLTSEGEIALVDDLGDVTRTVLYGIHRKTGVRRVLYEHPKYDVSYALLDPWKQTVIGVAVTASHRQRLYFDDELRAVHEAVATRLPGAISHLGSWDTGRRVFAVYAELPGDAGGWYLYRPTEQGGTLARIGMRYPELDRAEHIGKRQEIHYPSRDGTAIPAYLTLPHDTPNPPPLVVLPHGGPVARDTLDFDWWAAFLASRGYAVVQPNYRGSDGYGTTWERAGYQQWGQTMQHDVEDAVHALRDAGLVDDARACIVGASYGGYAALVGGTLTPSLYQCVVSVAGVSDLPLMLSTERRRYRDDSGVVDWWTLLIGDIDNDRERLEAMSPISRVADTRAPFLIIHGKLDTVVPIKQSETFVAAMKQAGKPVRFVELPTEDHWLSEGPARTRMLEEIEAFLAGNL